MVLSTYPKNSQTKQNKTSISAFNQLVLRNISTKNNENKFNYASIWPFTAIILEVTPLSIWWEDIAGGSSAQIPSFQSCLANIEPSCD